MYVEYDSNNSGGHWWLDDDDWAALEKAGWIVEWVALSPLYDDEGEYVREKNGTPKLVRREKNNSRFSLCPLDADGRWLGALAKCAYKPDCESLKEAAADWEKITGKSPLDAGCPCCGQPHNFTLYDDNGKHVDSGPDTNYECSW